MGFLQKISHAAARFMYGRNRIDQLGTAMICGCLLLDIVSMFVIRRWILAGRILYWATLALWAWAMFRIFSKNLPKRREENSKWVNWVWRMKNGRAAARERHADKDHKYFTCKNCGAICRVPVGKGKIVITCPKCGAQIHART